MTRPSWNRLQILRETIGLKLETAEPCSASHANRIRGIQHRFFVWSIEHSIEALKGTERQTIKHFNGEAYGTEQTR